MTIPARSLAIRCSINVGDALHAGPGDAVLTPPGHDAWVLGNEPVVLLDFKGAAMYAKK